MMAKEKTWKEMPEGNIIDRPATALEYKTGAWRAKRPVWIKENCIQCKFCLLYCPDMAVKAEGEKLTGFIYEYCKGCGICAKICPAKPKAIEMMTEADAKDEKKVNKLIEEKKKR